MPRDIATRRVHETDGLGCPPPTPAELFQRIVGQRRVAFLDGRAALDRAPWSHLAWNPLREFRVEADGSVRLDDTVRSGVEPIRAIGEFLRTESAAGRTVIGVLGYDLAGSIEPRAASRRSGTLPAAVLASYPAVRSFHHLTDAWSSPPPEAPPARESDCTASAPWVSIDEVAYARLFERARSWIAAGDIYQVNLSIALEAEIAGEPAIFYERLASRHPVPYGAFLDFGDFRVLGNSPELFLARRGDRIFTRPIKGTRPRGRTAAEDECLREELRASEKDRAEHVMIVDLERSDLGRIAETGSVRVDELERVASYPTLHHLESTVSARLRSGTDFAAILRATFPGGSITGAPKIRAMQIIDELEEERRGIYTGAILHYPPNGDFTMAIAIRTATVVGNRIRYAAGSGLVWDSDAAHEYRECLLKARAFVNAFRRA